MRKMRKRMMIFGRIIDDFSKPIGVFAKIKKDPYKSKGHPLFISILQSVDLLRLKVCSTLHTH
jgi:hypothetical protein